jgi:hypothetical protein
MSDGKKARWCEWYGELDDEGRRFVSQTPPSVGWCSNCRLLVVAYYTGHGVDQCQHCGAETESLEMAKAIPSERDTSVAVKTGHRIRFCNHCGMENDTVVKDKS